MSFAELLTQEQVQRVHDASQEVLEQVGLLVRSEPARALFAKAEHSQHEVSIEVFRNRLQKFCERVEEKNSFACVHLVTKMVVKVGYPAEEILKAADEEGCDLIALGSHGKGFLRHAFLGSVSRSVLDRALNRFLLFLCPLKKLRSGMKCDGLNR